MKNKFTPLVVSLLGTAIGYVLSNPLLFRVCLNTYQFGGVLGCSDKTVQGLGQPLLIFSAYSLIVTLGLLFTKKPVLKSWCRFSCWFVPLSLLFIFILPVTSTGSFLQSPALQYFRDDAARDAGRAFILLSLVVILWALYGQRKIRKGAQ